VDGGKKENLNIVKILNQNLLMNKEAITLKYYLNYLPLRIAVTDYCNLKCFFCSNEGMPLCNKNKTHININELKYLVKSLANEGLKNVSITGGEPTLHPQIIEIINFLNKFNFKNLFFHTNGINLTEKLVKKLSEGFTKIAISLHSANFKTWQKLTGGTKKQFKILISNLKMISKFSDRPLIELKYVPIKGYNDSEKEFKSFLELCNSFKFKFKFLNFEPIIQEHQGLEIPFEKIKETLIKIGCKFLGNDKYFRDQNRYLPIKKFKYKNIFGVAIEIGCGDPKVCKECYRVNEIFISPEMKIKPCHISDYQIDLKKFVNQKEKKKIFQTIVHSREFLFSAPGSGSRIWQ